MPFSVALRVLALLSLLLLCGCGKDAEDIFQSTYSEQQEILRLLRGVKDEASADRAAERLQDIRTRLENLQKTAGTLDTPETEEYAELRREYQAKLDEGRKQIREELVRIDTENPALIARLRNAYPELPYPEGHSASDQTASQSD